MPYTSLGREVAVQKLAERREEAQKQKVIVNSTYLLGRLCIIHVWDAVSISVYQRTGLASQICATNAAHCKSWVGWNELESVDGM